MKKTFIIFFVMMVFTGLNLSPHIASAQQKTSSESIKLLFAIFDPPVSQWGQAHRDWAKDLETKTNGRVKVQLAWAGAVGKPDEIYDLLVSGVCDVAMVGPAFTPGLFPMSEIISLPFVVPTAQIGGKALLELNKRGYFKKEYTKVQTMVLFSGIGDLIFTKKQVANLADLHGLKLLGVVPPVQARIKVLGGVPVTLNSPMDIYPALQKGILDGVVLPWPIAAIFKVHTLAKFVIVPGMGTTANGIFMNKDYYSKLPPDIQGILSEMLYEHSMNYAKVFNGIVDSSRKLFSKTGGQIAEWRPEDIAKMDELFAPLWEDWISEKEAKGSPAKKAVDDMYQILKSLGVDKPAVGYTPGS